MERAAKCLCGQFSVIVAGEPIMVNVCHCLSMSFWEKRRYAWSPQVGDVQHWNTQPPPP